MNTTAQPSIRLPLEAPSVSSRRQFLTSALGLVGAASLPGHAVLGGEGSSVPEGARPATMHLGLVTYNLAKDWDVPTIIRHCTATRFEGVELRTTHAHGVEVTLSPAQRAEVKQRFRDSCGRRRENGAKPPV